MGDHDWAYDLYDERYDEGISWDKASDKVVERAVPSSEPLLSIDGFHPDGGSLTLSAGGADSGRPATLELKPNGEIWFQDRKITTDPELVEALREFVMIVSEVPDRGIVKPSSWGVFKSNLKYGTWAIAILRRIWSSGMCDVGAVRAFIAVVGEGPPGPSPWESIVEVEEPEDNKD